MQKKTQVSKLIAYLRRNKRGITTLEAAANLGICSLHRRISDAAMQGHFIHGRKEKGKNYFRYKLIYSSNVVVID